MKMKKIGEFFSLYQCYIAIKQEKNNTITHWLINYIVENQLQVSQ